MAGAILASHLLAPGAAASEYVVHMMSESPEGSFRFMPSIVYAQPGDTVRFVDDDGMHAVKTIPGMLPAGAQPWRGRIGEDVTVHLTEPGVYGVKCRAGYEVGMVALLIVGDDPPNLDEAEAVRHPPTAAMAFRELFAEAECHLRRAECPQ